MDRISKSSLAAVAAVLFLTCQAGLADSAVGPIPTAAPSEVLQRYLAAMELQQTRLQGATMQVSIEAKLPRLKKQGKLEALRQVTRLGQVTYDAVRYVGDKMVKNDVITRYLNAEAQAINGHANGNSKPASMAIDEENYKFKYKGMIGLNGRWLYVFQLTPKQKRLGLFKGDLWIDAQMFLPFRESGRLVKNPSVFLKKVEFIREYEIVNGMALPKRIESRVQTRIVGRAELSIEFNNIMPDETARLNISPLGW
jgi:hypothetical protein